MAEKPAQAQGLAARLAAVEALGYVMDNAMTLDDALDKVFGRARLADPDKRLVHAMTAFALRNLNHIDVLLRRVMNRKRDPNPQKLHNLLRIGVAQLLYMGIAPHAAVHTCVSAAGSLRLITQKSLVNAVLRAVQREKEAGKIVQPDALNLLPQWLSNRWIRNYGESDAKALAQVLSQEAPIDVSVKDAQASLQWVQDMGGETLLPGHGRVHGNHGQITSWPGFREGAWWIQDLASSLPIRLLVDVADKSVLDVCAAPGGKTMQLAARGARVVALDVSGSRMERVTENLQRTKLADRVKIDVGDALHWRTGQRFSIVVLDAPCSSTGTLRRHPELPWNHSEKTIEKMTLVQRDLLRRAPEWLVHDGILLYCTCSLEPEEGENQLEAFLAEHKDFKEITDIPAELKPYLKRGIRNLGFRSNPLSVADRGGMDGFFMALLQRQ